MIDSRLRLSVLHDDDGTFADRSEEALDYSRDPFPITFDTDDFLYIGYRKPIGAVYVELATVNANANTLSFEYWNGDEWRPLAARDLTKGLTRSGWFTWDKPDDWAANDVDTVEDKFWVRCNPSATHSATSVQAMNLVFADDYDLQTEFPTVIDTSFIPQGEVSHIKTHVAVRNQLIQDLRSKGYIKQDSSGNWLNLTPWDLHDIEEVRQAATFLALSKIFFNYSDDPNDHWLVKSKAYEDKYKANLTTLAPSVDADDDGVEDKSEQRVVKVTRMYR